MSQSSVSPNVYPKRNRPPPSSSNASLQSDIHFDSVPAKSSVLSDSSGFATTTPTTTAVASSTPSMAAGTLKRLREEDYGEAAEAGTSGDVPEAKRRVKATHNVIYRIVVPSRQIGKVIGKAGYRIQKIREDTQATVKVADAISKHEERVIIISSKDNENVFSDAENALHQIVSLILQDDDGNMEALKIGPGHVPANAVRLLIAGSQAGGLIGVSGQNIVNLRNISGASIIVLSPNQMPPCASAHESDRVVQISGEIPIVLRAVVEIGCQLRDNPPKQVISISPSNNVGLHRQPQQHVDPTSADYVNLDLLVPENLVGGLIGRFGANISRIRNESGANVKVHGGRGEQSQRQIRLGGTAQQVALAKQRVDEYVYAELMRQAGGQMPLSAGQLQPYPTPQPMPDLSNTLYQGYGHSPALYTTSNHDVGMMAAPSSIYPSSATTQAPPQYYYTNQSYHAPPL